MTSNDKYKHFRNFMVNELGITRTDIQAWTKEAVANEVNKIVKNLDIDKRVSDAISKEVKTAVGGSIQNRWSTPNELQRAIAKEITENLSIEISHK